MRRAVTALILAGTLLSCDKAAVPGIPGVGGRDENSGGDHVRGKAVELKVGETHDDHVSAPDGDHTDWKKFTLPTPTLITINAWWDDPSVEASIAVRDQFGGQIFALQHRRGERNNHWPGMKLREGEYYLEVVASEGASVYTLELLADGELPHQGGPSGGDIAPPE